MDGWRSCEGMGWDGRERGGEVVDGLMCVFMD